MSYDVRVLNAGADLVTDCSGIRAVASPNRVHIVLAIAVAFRTTVHWVQGEGTAWLAHEWISETDSGISPGIVAVEQIALLNDVKTRDGTCREDGLA